MLNLKKHLVVPVWLRSYVKGNTNEVILKKELQADCGEFIMYFILDIASLKGPWDIQMGMYVQEVFITTKLEI